MLVDTSGDLNVKPTNVAVAKGSRCVMECGTNIDKRAVLWYYKDQDNSPRQLIYTGYRVVDSVTSIYSVIQFALVINFTLPHIAGTYICEEAGSKMNASAELVVLGMYGHN